MSLAKRSLDAVAEHGGELFAVADAVDDVEGPADPGRRQVDGEHVVGAAAVGEETAAQHGRRAGVGQRWGVDVAGARPCAVDDDVAGDPADDGDVRAHVLHEPERSDVDARWDGGALRSEAAGRQRGAPGVEAMAEHVEGVDEQAVQLGRRRVGESLQPGVEVVPRADVLARAAVAWWR